MDRRRLLQRLTALGALGLAGCVASTGAPESDGASPGTTSKRTTTTTTTTADPGTPRPESEREYEATTPPDDPEKPDPLTGETAVTYVEGVQLRESYEKLAFDDLQELSLDCKTFLHRVAGPGYVVLSGCGGYSSGGGSHADAGGTPVFYFVSPDRAVRVASVDRASVGDPYAGPDGENVDYPVGVRLYNFREQDATFDVSVVHRESGETAYSGEHGVPAESGIVVDELVRRRGTYDLAVAAAGVETTYSWSVTGRRGSGYDPVTVTLAPGPDLGVRRSKIPEIVGLGPV